MPITIPLDKMTTSDKLLALEQIWENLQQTAENIPSPAWHEDVLRAREARVREGSSQFEDWSQAKRAIRDRAR